MNWISKTMNNW